MSRFKTSLPESLAASVKTPVGNEPFLNRRCQRLASVISKCPRALWLFCC